jgi:hypothetical protein
VMRSMPRLGGGVRKRHCGRGGKGRGRGGGVGGAGGGQKERNNGKLARKLTWL